MTNIIFKSSEYNPVDFVYRSMGCKIQLMDQSDLMVQMILKYIHSYEDNSEDHFI